MIPALSTPLCHPRGRFVKIPTVIRVWSLLQDPELSIRKITLVEEAGLYQRLSDAIPQDEIAPPEQPWISGTTRVVVCRSTLAVKKPLGRVYS